ncbi:MAG: Gfo/Idh/MocA family oxidoreductase [Phycisphaerae bacterium]|jgi:predicted dehydrogenase
MYPTRTRLTRRKFILSAAAAGATLWDGWKTARGQARPRSRRLSPNEKLNIGIVGAGGRGADNLNDVAGENVVALCDCDWRAATGAFKKFPNAARYRDWRKMLDAEKSLDAVVVSTPDHNHAIIAVSAMRLGKHVYCEKPLARTIWEARLMSRTAAEMKVATQMGTQGHAFEGTRRAVEVLRSGAIGPVRELHVWTDRAEGWWPQGIDRPTDTPPVPQDLDWDVWLGPAAYRPYHPAYLPFKWRGFWDFGTGAIGDMGIHNLDTAFWGLELGLPTSARVVDSSPRNAETAPAWSILELRFPARGDRPPVKLTWYDGRKQPPRELFHGEPFPTNGSLVIGEKGTLFTRTWNGGESDADMFLLLPRKDFADFRPPAPTLPRAPGHHQEWIAACKGGPPALSEFGYAARLTEALLVGALALRTGKAIEWDAANMKAKGQPQADDFIRPALRAGWTL